MAAAKAPAPQEAAPRQQRPTGADQWVRPTEAAAPAAAPAATEADGPSASAPGRSDSGSNSGQGVLYMAASTRKKGKAAKWIYHTSPRCSVLRDKAKPEAVPAAEGRPLERANWHLCQHCSKLV